MPIDVSPSISARMRLRRISVERPARRSPAPRRRRRAGVVELAGVVGDPAGRAPLVEPLHEARRRRSSRGRRSRPARRARPTLSSEAPVFSRATRPGQVPEKLRGQQQRVVLADDAVDGVRGVGPVDEDADHRVVDRAELGDRLVGPGQEALDHVGRPAELLQGRDQLPGRLLRPAAGPTRSASRGSRPARRRRLSST